MRATSSDSQVALIRGEERYANVTKALEFIDQDINLSEARKILIKPNLISVTNQLAATHVDALRAVLDFLRHRSSSQIIIGEGSGAGRESTMIGFKNFAYLPLVEEYGVSFLDFHRDEFIELQVFDWQLKPLKVRLAKTIVESDFRISVCPPKTHDNVIVTASIKNVALGGLAYNDKIKMHQGFPVINLNLYRLAKIVPPHLSIIDGYNGMEGNGPVRGEEVDFGIAIASIDPVAADSLAAKLMGFDPSQIGYLVYCHKGSLGELESSNMNIIGEKVEGCIRNFKPHSSYKAQLQWQISGVEKSL